jgi:GxxExxY protein
MDHGIHGPHGRLLLREETFRIRGAIFEVYRAFGAGFLEGVYQEALAIEFEHQAIPFVAQPPLGLTYRGREMRQRYSPDFICFDQVIVELKAVRDFAPEHRAQLINYLRASGRSVGLLVNFGATPEARIERFAL